MLNILTDSLIKMDTTDGTCSASLPEVYTYLMTDSVHTFPALRPHQRHAWHAFLVQLGVMAMRRAGLTEPPDDAAEWLRIIRALTPEWSNDEPWQLVVEDITTPAFMQPPASAASKRSDYKDKDKDIVTTPDELDMLVTSKNHDLKLAVAKTADVDDWIFALVTLQTMEGYSGRNNYGISRMHSGYGNRSAFSLTPSFRPGAHVRHDLGLLLKHGQSVLDEYQMNDSGITLLWTIPWDGLKAESKLITEMDAFYIEVCRRVRLYWKYDKLNAVRANSGSMRMVDVKGLTGDPWMPVSNNTNAKGNPPTFLVPRKFFGYERVVDGLLYADWKQPILFL